MSAINSQIGGSHYKDCAIQPVEYIHANKLGYFEGCAIKYLTRWKSKGGIQDLEKAKHYIDLLIELETQETQVNMIGDNSGGWIKWGGGACPVIGNTVVEIKYKGFLPSKPIGNACDYVWKHDGADDDIIAYRVVNQA